MLLITAAPIPGTLHLKPDQKPRDSELRIKRMYINLSSSIFRNTESFD